MSNRPKRKPQTHTPSGNPYIRPFTLRVAGGPLVMTVTVELPGVSASNPEFAAQARTMVQQIVGRGLEVIGPVVHASVFALVKEDPDGFDKLQDYYLKALSVVRASAIRACENLEKSGKAFPSVQVAAVIPQDGPRLLTP